MFPRELNFLARVLGKKGEARFLICQNRNSLIAEKFIPILPAVLIKEQLQKPQMKAKVVKERKKKNSIRSMGS